MPNKAAKLQLARLKKANLHSRELQEAKLQSEFDKERFHSGYDKVLIIENEASDANAIGKYLEKKNFEVMMLLFKQLVEIKSNFDFEYHRSFCFDCIIKKIVEVQPDILLIDINLYESVKGDTSGIELAKLKNTKVSKIPHILITANDENKDVLSAASQTASYINVKPYWIKSILTRKRSTISAAGIKDLESSINDILYSEYVTDKVKFEYLKTKVDFLEKRINGKKERLKIINKQIAALQGELNLDLDVAKSVVTEERINKLVEEHGVTLNKIRDLEAEILNIRGNTYY